MEKKNIDKNLTVYVDNTALEELLKIYSQEKTTDNLNHLLDKLTASRILVPANRMPENNQPMPCLLKAKSGESMLPIYTSLKHVQNAPKSAGLINMPYVNANEMVASANGEVNGIVINPFTDNLVFKLELIQKIKEVEAMKKQGVQQVRMSKEQYAIFERITFEKQFLPKKLFEEGQEFIDKLKEEKESYLDVLFEESYQQKRMYPYLEEEFSTMFLQISDTLLIVRIELPNRDLGQGVSERLFLAWDDAKQEARYFTISLGKEKGTRNLCEIGKDYAMIDYGAAPVEGAELQRVVDLVGGISTSEYTS